MDKRTDIEKLEPPVDPLTLMRTEADDVADPKGYPNSSVTKTIYCQISGATLGRLDICIFEGHMVYFESHSESVYLHPFYRLSNVVLCKKLEDSLHHAQENGWILSWREQQRMQLLVSAIMHQLDCIKQEQPGLPTFQIAAGSAGRLLHLARWYFFISSQRLSFPIYSVSKKNENLGWNNYKYWMDAALKVRENWSKKAKTLELDEKKKAQDESMKAIKSEAVYRRLDIRKIWNWIQLQICMHHSPRQVEVWKELFLNGDLEVHEWILDDVDDLRDTLLKHCDIGNEIMFFIRKRLDGIAALIKDFRSGFTLVSGSTGQFTEEEHTAQETQLFGEFDRQAEALETLPPKPTRDSFETNAKFWQAEACWNILAKRYKKLQEAKKLVEELKKQPKIDNVGPNVEDL